MEIILLEKVHNLGTLGDKVRVRAGYGRNYLIPRKKAVPATADNVTKFEAQRAELEHAQMAAHDSAAARVVKLQGLEVIVSAKAGTEGRLYGSVGTTEICAAVTAAGHTIDKREVRLPDGPLRALGRHSIAVQLHPDITTEIVIVINAEEPEK